MKQFNMEDKQKDIASLLKETFGEENIETFSCEMKYTKEVGEYLIKIEEAHKRASNSSLIFRNSHLNYY